MDAEAIFWIGSPNASLLSNYILAGAGNILDPGGGGNTVAAASPRKIISGADVFEGSALTIDSQENKAFKLFAFNGAFTSDPFTGGDAANYMLVSVNYSVIDL